MTASESCRFEFAPPRHFLYPAILLLLAEQPRHGYRLVDAYLGLGFGPVDRPAVYRALAELQRDGLILSWGEVPTAGSIRHVYDLTPVGRDQLRKWMAVTLEKRDRLTQVLDRYDRLEPAVPTNGNGNGGRAAQRVT